MTAAHVLAEMRRAGVVLIADGDKLRLRAPAAVLTPELRELARTHKTELLGVLSGPVGATAAPVHTAPCSVCGRFRFNAPTVCFWCRQQASFRDVGGAA